MIYNIVLFLFEGEKKVMPFPSAGCRQSQSFTTNTQLSQMCGRLGSFCGRFSALLYSHTMALPMNRYINTKCCKNSKVGTQFLFCFCIEIIHFSQQPYITSLITSKSSNQKSSNRNKRTYCSNPIFLHSFTAILFIYYVIRERYKKYTLVST